MFINCKGMGIKVWCSWKWSEQMIHRTSVRISKYLSSVPRRYSICLQVRKCPHSQPNLKRKGKYGRLILYILNSVGIPCILSGQNARILYHHLYLQGLNLWPAGVPPIKDTVAGVSSPVLCELSRKKNKTKPTPKPKIKKPTWYLSALRPFLSFKDFKNTQKIHTLVKEYFPSLMGENCHCSPQWQYLLRDKKIIYYNVFLNKMNLKFPLNFKCV